MAELATLTPDWISAPGETIEDILEERGWSKKDFADRAGFSTKHVNELTKGRVIITADAAERLARVLGSTPTFWLTRDAQYQARLERQKSIELAINDADWLKEIPLAWMKKCGWVRAFRNRGEQVLECLSFFGVHSVDAWRGKYQTPLVAFRSSDKFDKKDGAVAAWLRQAEVEATALQSDPFNERGFRAALGNLRALTQESDPAVFVPKLVELCAQNGVAVVFVPAPKGCPVSGATQWLLPDKAMLALSLRFKTNDHLWFTFFHEAAHILKHSKKMLFIEGMKGLDKTHEDEADHFASNWLISLVDAKRLHELSKKSYLSKDDICAFAQQIGVDAGIVVGRMQKEGWLPWSHMNGLKVRFKWS